MTQVSGYLPLISDSSAIRLQMSVMSHYFQAMVVGGPGVRIGEHLQKNLGDSCEPFEF